MLITWIDGGVGRPNVVGRTARTRCGNPLERLGAASPVRRFRSFWMVSPPRNARMAAAGSAGVAANNALPGTWVLPGTGGAVGSGALREQGVARNAGVAGQRGRRRHGRCANADTVAADAVAGMSAAGSMDRSCASPAAAHGSPGSGLARWIGPQGGMGSRTSPLPHKVASGPAREVDSGPRGGWGRRASPLPRKAARWWPSRWAESGRCAVGGRAGGWSRGGWSRGWRSGLARRGFARWRGLAWRSVAWRMDREVAGAPLRWQGAGSSRARVVPWRLRVACLIQIPRDAGHCRRPRPGPSASTIQ